MPARVKLKTLQALPILHPQRIAVALGAFEPMLRFKDAEMYIVYETAVAALEKARKGGPRIQVKAELEY